MGKPINSNQGGAGMTPYVMLLPFLAVFGAFTVYPLVRSLVLAFHKTAGPGAVKYTGVGNFLYMWEDQTFWLGVVNTLFFTAGIVGLTVPLALVLGLLLNDSRLPGRAFFRALFFSTHLVGGVFVAVMFAAMLPRWVLSDPAMARGMVILAAVWTGAGAAMVYVLAALQGVPKELYEAASVDGAGTLSQFWHVTLPGISRVMKFLVLTGVIGALQIFELPYVLFNGIGPAGAGITFVAYLYSAGFEQGDLGYASAMGWVLLVMVTGVSVMSLRMVFGRQA